MTKRNSNEDVKGQIASWRDCAREALEIADAMPNWQSADVFRRIASSYESMAMSAEADLLRSANTEEA
jgi:hypothetical protein